MEGIFLSVVLLSGAAGILGLLLKGFFHFSKKQYRARAKTVVWMILLVSMLFPISINIPKPTAGALPLGRVVSENRFTLLPSNVVNFNEIQISEHSWITVLSWLWLGGLVLMLGVKLICYVAFLGKVKRHSHICEDEQSDKMMQEISNRLRIRRDVKLYWSSEIDTPLLMGFFRPSVYLPENSWTAEQRKMILLHEFFHLKGGHLFIQLFLLVATAVHWFNPVIYLVGGELKAALEESCDAAVLRQSSLKTRRLYGKTVLETACRQRKEIPAISAPFSARRSRLKDRCQRILVSDGTLCRGRGLVFGICAIMTALVIACALVPKPQVSADGQKTPVTSVEQGIQPDGFSDRMENWLFPVEGELYVTAPYGEKFYSFHKGLDVTRDGISGEEIHAAQSGVVVTANTLPHSYGNYVVIDHGGGYQTTYAHCQSLTVAVGQQVVQGETIAYVGTTGNSTGPHLHFEVQKDGESLDPVQLFPDLKELQ